MLGQQARLIIGDDVSYPFFWWVFVLAILIVEDIIEICKDYLLKELNHRLIFLELMYIT